MLRSAIVSLLLMSALGLPFAAAADCMGPYPPSLVKAFNDNCDPTKAAFCACLIDDVQKNIPLAEFIEIGNSPQGINSDPRFKKSSEKCGLLISGGTPAATAAPAANTTVPVYNTTAPGSSSPVPTIAGSTTPAVTPGTGGSTVRNQGAGTFK